MTDSPGSAIISIEGLSRHFESQDGGAVVALDGIDLDIRTGETLALIGESGSGKSTLGQVLLQLQKASAGKVLFDGRDITLLSEPELRPVHRALQIVFQDPLTALNPRMTVERAIADPIRFHKLLPEAAIRARVESILEDVGLERRFLSYYPHQLSGGQCQRVVIGRALACEPRFIVCDEATSALDVSVQAQILNLFVDLQERYGLTYLFISHDLAVVRHFADRIAVIYQGRLAELAPASALFSAPLHPYTRMLLAAAPALGKIDEAPVAAEEKPRWETGGSGCHFQARCPLASARCAEERPEWRQIRTGHFVACHNANTQTEAMHHWRAS